MSRFGFFLAVIFFLIVWARVSSLLAKARKQDPQRAAVWDQPAPPVVSQAVGQWARVEAPIRVRSSNTSSISPTEVHMNPISALVFIVFVGGAGFARLAAIALPPPL